MFFHFLTLRGYKQNNSREMVNVTKKRVDLTRWICVVACFLCAALAGWIFWTYLGGRKSTQSASAFGRQHLRSETKKRTEEECKIRLGCSNCVALDGCIFQENAYLDGGSGSGSGECTTHCVEGNSNYRCFAKSDFPTFWTPLQICRTQWPAGEKPH